MVGEIPAANMQLHVCLRSRDEIILVDRCPSSAVFEAFVQGDAFRALRERNGLPKPERIEDFPLHRAFVEGRELT